jgi:hypothetical protein
MAQKSYIFTHDYKAPYVTITGLAHNPQAVKFKKFQKGEIVRGELKHANNKPAFILVNGVCVVPLDIVKELVTKAVVSGADGTTTNSFPSKPKVQSLPTNPKVRYIDAMLVGAVAGVVAVFVAEKQGWISEPDNKYKLYGALIGAIGASYIVYRTNNAKPQIQVVAPTKDSE